MTITIEMPVEEESAIMQKAAYEGLSIGEYTRRALREKAAPLASPNAATHAPDDREPTRKEVKARVRTGYYIVSEEVSSDRLIAERREEARREARARIHSGYYVTPGLSSDGLIAERRKETQQDRRR